MSAREELHDTMWRTFGVAPEELSGMLDAYESAFAHELAEKQREAISKTDDPVFYAGESGWLPDLIDPEVDQT